LSYARKEEKVFGEEKPKDKRKKKIGGMNVGSFSAWLHAREEYKSKRLRRERFDREQYKKQVIIIQSLKTKKSHQKKKKKKKDRSVIQIA
jgi:hypothetical protein